MQRVLLPALLLIGLSAAASASPAFDGTATYIDTRAGYAIDYPAQAALSSGLDAALGFNTVFINFPSDSGGEFAGAIITVLDNPGRVPIDAFAHARLGLRPNAPGSVRAEWIGGMPALLAQRPSPLAGDDAVAALVEGDGVIIRFGLYGGGVDGPIDPPTQHFDWFNQIVHSIRRVPRAAPPVPAPPIDLDAAVPLALTFQLPFSETVTTIYAEQYGVAVSNTAYGVRNLGLSHVRTCFGADWPRLLHAGVDWFRADGQTATPTDVLAAADGSVAWYDPTYNTYPGKVVVVRHPLSDGRDVYSMYAHLGPDVSVQQGQVVLRGQRIGSMLYQGSNTHLHFELRTFLDASRIYAPYTACNGIIAGRGYTYRVHPDNFPASGAGYVDPIAFISTYSNPISNLPTGVPPDYSTTRRVTSTLRLSESDLAIVDKPGAGRTPVDAPIRPADPIKTVPIGTPTRAIEITGTLNLTYTTYLPILVREYPPREPACVEGRQLLFNTGLEDGPASAPWVQSSNGTADLIQEERPYTGTYGLWFGGRNLADEEALQAFMLPYYTEGITLTFQRYLTTTEVVPQPFDILEVVIENAAGVEVTPRVALDNASPQKAAWVPETVVWSAMQALGGQRLRLSIKIATDANLPTSFFLDELSATTQCAP